MKICERCGKEHDGSFGSGRFCSRSCANSHPMTDARRQNISKGLLKITSCNCKFCGSEFDSLIKRSSHEIRCDLNPNRKSINYGAIKNHNDKLNRKVRINNYKTNEFACLDITYQEL